MKFVPISSLFIFLIERFVALGEKIRRNEGVDMMNMMVLYPVRKRLEKVRDLKACAAFHRRCKESPMLLARGIR